MPILEVVDLKTQYFMEKGTVKAVDGVSFTMEKGDSVGIAGESGCGKTTVAMSLVRLIKGGRIVSGKVIFNGQSILDMPMKDFLHLRWNNIALVSQAAMGALNPVFTVGDQIVEAIRTHNKCTKAEAWAKTLESLNKVRVDPKRAKNYPHELSGGMRQRVMIAMALACDPEIIIADEMTTALDVVTQAQVLKLLIDLQKRLNLTLIYISHELSILGQACRNIIIMYAGKIVETGETNEIFSNPQHPYTQKLLSSLMDIRSTSVTLESIPGKPPNLINPPPGCRFWPRCALVRDQCKIEEPKLVGVGLNHYAACNRLTEIK